MDRSLSVRANDPKRGKVPYIPSRMSDRTGWITTVLQAVPRLFELVRHLRPTMHVAAVTALDEQFLATHSVSAILWDVDGTLMPHHDRAVAPEVRAILQGFGRRVPQAILSNCDDERLLELGVLFAELPVLKGYRLETGTFALRRLHEGRDEWWVRDGSGGQRLPAPPSRALPIRKPSAALVERAIEWMGADRERVVMIGDQYFTDIAGANLAGIRSVKVETLAPTSFPFAVRAFQAIESVVYRLIYGRRRR
jgi:predicted HAD superfamily phosphohydrolase YqeG